MIFRNHERKSYTKICNDVLRNKSLSLKARGLLCYLLSLPDEWNVNLAHLETISDKDGRTSVISGMRELKQGGYLVRTLERDNGVIVRHVWTVFEEPQKACSPENSFPRKQVSLNVGNRPLITTDRIITNDRIITTLTPNGSAVAQAAPSQEKGSDLLENEETGGNTLFSQFDGLHDTFPALAKTGAFSAKETANAGHQADSTKAKRKKHERNALLDALVVLDGTVLEFATGPAWSRAAAALKTIREVSPNVTASEIEAASRAYKRKFPDALCSSSALAKWWGSLQVPEPKSAYPSYSIGAPLTPEQKAEEEARANAMREFLRANSTTT